MFPKNAVANVLKSSKQIMDVFEDIGRVRHRLNNLSSLFAVEGKQSHDCSSIRECLDDNESGNSTWIRLSY